MVSKGNGLSKTKILTKVLFVVCAISMFFVFALGFAIFCLKNLYPINYLDYVKQTAIEFNLEESLIMSIIKVESGFNPKAKSNKGAIGLMQLTPSTAEYIKEMLKIESFDLFDEKTNIRFGGYYVRYLMSKFKSKKTAIIAYNAGEGNVRNWLKNKEYSLDGVNLINVPYKESQEYVLRVEKVQINYKKLYKNILDKKNKS